MNALGMRSARRARSKVGLGLMRSSGLPVLSPGSAACRPAGSDDLVHAMGLSGISKSQVSKLAGIDERGTEAFEARKVPKVRLTPTFGDIDDHPA
jgi:hypothetical protein